MIWILITVLVGLVVILAQLMLTYQKRASRLKIAQNPVRKQIDGYHSKITELGEEVRGMAGSSLKQLRTDMDGYQRRSGFAANLTAELDGEAQAWVAEREDETSDDDEPVSHDEEDNGDAGDDETADELLGGRRDPHMKVETDRTNPLDLVRAIRHDLEETYEYIEGLRTDAVIVQQTVERLGPKDKSKANGA